MHLGDTDKAAPPALHQNSFFQTQRQADQFIHLPSLNVLLAFLHYFPPHGEDTGSSDSTHGKLAQARAFALVYKRNSREEIRFTATAWTDETSICLCLWCCIPLLSQHVTWDEPSFSSPAGAQGSRQQHVSTSSL